MRAMKRLLLSMVTAAALASATLFSQSAPPVSQTRLVNAANEPQNWLMMNGDYGSIRYSKLTEINRQNVKNLRPVWGMRTGRVRWDVEVADYKTGHSLTSAPLAVKDKVIVGMAGAEYGVRGFLDAYDAATGKRAWRLWTVPGPGEPGHETWSGDSWKYGGATTWVTGAFDPETNLLYWGTGNPGPDFIGDARAGDNLYADSMIAVDADTGALRWHFQFTPHDVNDIDSTEIPILIDAEFRGRPRKLLLFANRNGFYYIFDRVTGEYLHAKAFARQTWAKGLDPKGRPIPNPDTVPSAKGALVYPDDDGVTNWFSPSYSPQTKTFYQNVREKGGIYSRNEAVYQPGRMYLGASKRAVPDEEPWGALRALDPLTGDMGSLACVNIGRARPVSSENGLNRSENF